MELSICIPIYNQNVTPLVNELRAQALRADCQFEILLMDDASTRYKEANSRLCELEGVRFIGLEKNVGRSVIRNKLADEAFYDYLLFMDCDVLPYSPDFLEKYIQMEGHDVVVGGYRYEEQPISDAYTFRWKYGKKREERSAATRNRRPNDSFSTFNFLIKKSIFKQVRFDESLKGYGHEDTFFGISLKEAGVKVTHIDNPLLHLGYDNSAVFLEKSRNSVHNLWAIYGKVADRDGFADSVKLLRYYRSLERSGLVSLCATLFTYADKVLQYNLLGKSPYLFLFDLYKLGTLCVCSSH